jgi:leucyl-tRNA synthetase
MILLNGLEKLDEIPVSGHNVLVRLLAPFAPHLAEELWERGGHTESVHQAPWPVVDETVLHTAQVTIAVQVDGKTRATFSSEPGRSRESLIAEARAHAKIAPRLQGREVVKEVVVPDRLVSLVTTMKTVTQEGQKGARTENVDVS